MRVKFREITYLAKFFWNIQSPTLQSLVLIFIIHFDILLHQSKLYDFCNFESNVKANWYDDLEDDNIMQESGPEGVIADQKWGENGLIVTIHAYLKSNGTNQA